MYIDMLVNLQSFAPSVEINVTFLLRSLLGH